MSLNRSIGQQVVRLNFEERRVADPVRCAGDGHHHDSEIEEYVGMETIVHSITRPNPVAMTRVLRRPPGRGGVLSPARHTWRREAGATHVGWRVRGDDGSGVGSGVGACRP